MCNLAWIGEPNLPFPYLCITLFPPSFSLSLFYLFLSLHNKHTRLCFPPLAKHWTRICDRRSETCHAKILFPLEYFCILSLSLERDRKANVELCTQHLAPIKPFMEGVTKFWANSTNFPLPLFVCVNCWKHISIWIMSNERILLFSIQMVQTIHGCSQSLPYLFL